MRNPLGLVAIYICELGTKNGMPRYTAFLALVMVTILFIPEPAYSTFGLNALIIKNLCPVFSSYYIDNSNFENAMTVFWLVAPAVSAISTVISIWHFNVIDYQAYLQRRAKKLERLGKNNDFPLIFGVLALIAGYVWSTAIYQVEPRIFGGFTPPNSRFAMIVFHVGALGLIIPFGLAFLVAEIRASLFPRNNSERAN